MVSQEDIIAIFITKTMHSIYNAISDLLEVFLPENA